MSRKLTVRIEVFRKADGEVTSAHDSVIDFCSDSRDTHKQVVAVVSAWLIAHMPYASMSVFGYRVTVLNNINPLPGEWSENSKDAK